MADVVMPRLSDSMEEGTILRWFKSAGDAVRRGDELVEIETDKATMTYEADADGVLTILAEEGATLPIGELIARLGDASGGTPEGSEGAVGGHPAAPPAVADRESPDAAQPKGDATAPSDNAVRETLDATGPAPDAPLSDGGARIKASPVARRVARDRGIDLRTVVGTGPGGRIVRADVERSPVTSDAPVAPAAASTGSAAPREVESTPAAPGTRGESNRGTVTTVQTTRTQQVIARRMAESRATIPSFEVSTDVAMGAAVAFRSQLKTIPGREHAPSYNDLIVKACALALREHPRVNGAYRDGAFELYERINVGVAVAADSALVVPVISRADEKPLSQIAHESRTLAARVRDGVITPPEVSGGTFTVSNLGMLGVSHFTAVINPGQAAILAVGALTTQPVVRDGAIVAGQTMTLTLASDHRILYGADSARFLARVREFLEHPLAMVA